MSEFGDVASQVVGQVGKLLKGMSEDDVKRVASGETKVALIPPGRRVLDYTPALDAALKFLQKLTPEDLHQLEEKLVRLELLRKGDTVQRFLDVAEIATRVSQLDTEDEIVRYLDADSRLTPAKLKLVARELRIDVPPSVKSKPALQLHIAQNAVQARSRWSWR
jgi:hypothetical protein